ncbi:ferredoxin [Actinocorallia herbida]|uniref:Ferredoxin n=1 Tax=Actinocorallia herbida TaxID=58109 RepID=A0A3N1CWI0_9ACTN|nr:2Fe-2S iron-sulfur cluster-binding protein [Actinocorallia herbida]ROO85647.1 ferredoxin [Actinocorallia herbida]
MPWVRIQPSGTEFEVFDGEAVAEAAWRQGHGWPTQCWGQADCMSCFTRILDGELCALPAEQDELDAVSLKMSPQLRSNHLIRLGCRLRCVGDGLVLEKQGFRPADRTGEDTADPAGPPPPSPGAEARAEPGRT